MPIGRPVRKFYQPRGALHVPAMASGDTTTGLISYWPFNEGSGTTATDTQSAHNAALSGNLTTGWTGTPGWFDTSTALDNAFGAVTDHADFNFGSAMTAFCWVKGATATVNSGIFGQYDFNDQRAWMMATDAATGTKLRVIVVSDGLSAGSGNSKTYEGSQTVYEASVAHSICFRWNSGTLDLFNDGVLDASVTQINNASFSSIHNSAGAILGIGDWSSFGVHGGVPYGGALRKARLYNTAKTNADIAAIHALG